MVLGQLDGQDLTQMLESDLDMEQQYGEAITIKKFVSLSGTPTAGGLAPDPVYTDFKSVAFLLDLGIGAMAQANDAMVAGDIHLNMREQLNESDIGNNGTHPGDRLVYRGSLYRLVQRPIPVSVGAVLFYETWLRRVNPRTDVKVVD